MAVSNLTNNSISFKNAPDHRLRVKKRDDGSLIVRIQHDWGELAQNTKGDDVFRGDAAFVVSLDDAKALFHFLLQIQEIQEFVDI